MSFLRFNRSAWPIFLLVSALPRILCAFFLPNAFGDAYVYIHDIGSLSIKISTGSFRLSDLQEWFLFWEARFRALRRRLVHFRLLHNLRTHKEFKGVVADLPATCAEP